MSKSDNKRVKVFVRPRPMGGGVSQPCLFLLDCINQKVTANDETVKSYEFDGVLPMDCSQADVYQSVVSPLVKAVLEGFNATVLAYGQTGSGKTHTMGTGCSALADQGKEGILQRVLSCLLSSDALKAANKPFNSRRSQRLSKPFQNLESYKNLSIDASGNNNHGEDCNNHDGNPRGCEAAPTVKLVFLEVYMEKVFDLLSSSKVQLVTKPDSNGGITPVGCTEVLLHSLQEAAEQLSAAVQRRAVAATASNAYSSRSHALVGIQVEHSNKRSVLRLVDLAGSERVGQISEKSQVFSEGVAINKELLALGKVLTALAAGNMHVPYRDSTLTQLLRKSMSGNSLTAMIACVSLDPAHATQTHNTLGYAEQTRNVRTRPVQAPTSTLRLSVKRRLEDPTATPQHRKKHINGTVSVAKTFQLSDSTTFKGCSSTSLSVPKKQFFRPPLNTACVTKGITALVNSTVSTPGHTPSSKFPMRVLNNTFDGNVEQSFAIKRPLFVEDTDSPRFLPTRDSCCSNKFIASHEKSDCVSVANCKVRQQVMASSPLQGITKLEDDLTKLDLKSIISPLVNRLQDSMFSRMEARMDQFFSRMTRRQSRKDSLNLSRSFELDLPECLSPNLDNKVLDLVTSSKQSRRSSTRRRINRTVLDRTVMKNICSSSSKQDFCVKNNVCSDDACTLVNNQDNHKEFDEFPAQVNEFLMPDLPPRRCNKRLGQLPSSAQNILKNHVVPFTVPSESFGGATGTPPTNAMCTPRTSTCIMENKTIRRSVYPDGAPDPVAQRRSFLNISIIQKPVGEFALPSADVTGVKNESKVSSHVNTYLEKVNISGIFENNSLSQSKKVLSDITNVQDTVCKSLPSLVKLTRSSVSMAAAATQTSFTSGNSTIINCHTNESSVTNSTFLAPNSCPVEPSRVYCGQNTVQESGRRSRRMSAIVATERNRILLTTVHKPITPSLCNLNSSVRNTRKTKGLNVSANRTHVVSPSVFRNRTREVLKLLNTGSVRDLQQLSLIGPKTAYVIVTHRTVFGEFSSLQSLDVVGGLPRTFLSRFVRANLLSL